jgi:hypothetical protein
MEHSIHLGAGHFISHVTPTLSKGPKSAMQGLYSDELDEELDVADALGKALALVNQVFDYCPFINRLDLLL